MFEVKSNAKGQYPDEPLTGDSCPNSDDYCYTNHVYTQDQDETYDMIFQWRELMTEFAKTHDNFTKIIMTEAYTSLDNMIRFYGDGKRSGSNIPFNFEMISNVNKESTAKDYKLRIDNWLNRVPRGSHANWVLGNHDQHRMATRLGVERGDLLNIMLQTLPGIAVTYQGEEMMLENTHLTWEETVDPSACNTKDPINYEASSRDPCRTPFPWNAEKNAGFSTNDTTWLPVKDDYATNNVETQLKAENSHLKIFMKLVKLRKTNVLRQGNYEGKLVNNENVLIYRRWYGEEDLVVVILNFGSDVETVNVKNAFPEITEEELLIYTASLDTEFVAG
jgi:alpha-glucosidase